MAPCVSVPCIDSYCTNPEHNIPFHSCTDPELSKLFFCFDADYVAFHNKSVNYANVDDSFSMTHTVDGPQLECDLLYHIDIRNSTNCIITDSYEQMQVDLITHDTLLIHLNIRSIPAHLSEFEVVLSFLTKLACTIIGISETWLGSCNELLDTPMGLQIVPVSRQGGSGGEGEGG